MLNLVRLQSCNPSGKVTPLERSVSMRRRNLSLLAPAALLILGGCMSAATPSTMQAQSTCHTSRGDFVPTPGCTVSYSVNQSSTTVTTTTTTTTSSSPPVDEDDET